jgi:integrase
MLDFDRLLQALQGFFVHLRNSPLNETSGKRWHDALGFVRDIVEHQSRSGSVFERNFGEVTRQLVYLESLYNQLQVPRKTHQTRIRSLPATVVEALFTILTPGSSDNPFNNEKSQWRAFVGFNILLYQGLRRGELLLLPTDAVKTAFDRKLGSNRSWLNVTENPYETVDPRKNRPSIKNQQSYRQIPVNDRTRLLIQTYVENYRGKPRHSFLINSQFDRPLSHEALTKLFQKISNHLPGKVLKELEERTGKTSVTPHDLRHTCAVIFLNQLLKLGNSMGEALAKMRIFFGWAPGSDMPVRYARAVFEDRLAGVWSQIFADQVDILRTLPGDSNE